MAAGEAETARTVLVIAPHPDDAEIGCGGVMALLAARGVRVVIVDLTRGEMGSTGTPRERLAEGRRAARILGCAARENLGLPDFGLTHCMDHVRPVTEAIRRHKPDVVLTIRGDDPHPDHNACHEIVRGAYLAAGLPRLPVGGEPHHPGRLFSFSVGCHLPPDFVIDITGFQETKRKALLAHKSQFKREKGGRGTPLNDPAYLEGLLARDRYFGWQVGVKCAEGLCGAGRPLVDALPGLALPGLALPGLALPGLAAPR